MLDGVLGVLAAAVCGYAIGAIPTGYVLARHLRGVDLRRVGSGHTGGSNLARSAGFAAGAGAAIVDVLLGVAAVAVASALSDSPWAATAAGVMAIVGHDWSAFIGFGGGVGLTTVGGALLYHWPARVLVVGLLLVVVWLFLARVAHVHRARTTVATLLLAGPALWVGGIPLNGVLLGALGGAVAIVKTLPDWNRQYP
jgi:glycerol-3-phosphate acyltransferase PlsY